MFIHHLIILSLSVNAITGLYYNDTSHLESIKSDAILFFYYHPWFNQTINFLQNLSNSKRIDSKCKSSLKRWIYGIEDREAWAIKFLESTGKTINGKLIGRNVNFGSFEYCTLFYADPSNKIDFDGKYCLVSLQTQESELIKNLPNFKKYYNLLTEESRRLTLYNLGNAHGICIPSTCDINQLVSVSNDLLKPIFNLMAPKKCSTRSEPEPWTKIQIFSIATLSVSILLCFSSFYFKNGFIKSFSLVDNLHVIYHVDSVNSKEKGYLHGAKACLLIGSIGLHSCLFTGIYFAQALAPVKEIFTENLDNQGAFYYIRILMERLVLVAGQMFFFGGFFAMYGWYDVIKYKMIKFSYLKYVLARYFRIFIILVPILLLYFVLPQIGGGPYYSDITNHLTINCKRTYHKIFLQTSNIGDYVVDICNIAAWYTSADFQIYLVNYFLIYYLVTKPKIGFILVFFQMILNNMIGLLYRRWFNLPNMHNHFNIDFYEISTTQDLYFPSIFHHDAYVIGILCAYFVKTNKRFKILEFRIVRMAIWIGLMTSIYLIVFWYPHYLEVNNIRINKYLEIFYPFFDGILMSCLSFWLIYSLSLGYTKFFGQFLSLKFWVPISRLSFAMSLSQFIYITYSFATTRSSFTLHFGNLIKEVLNNVIFTFLLSNFIFLIWEGPMISLFKKYFNQQSRSELTEKNLKTD